MLRKKNLYLRTVAIDSCRTSNPYVNFMENWKGMTLGRWVCYKTLFRGAYLLCSYFAKPPVVYKHFICLKLKENGVHKQECWKQQTNSIFHQMNMKTCKMKIYATFRTLGLISVVSYFYFDFSFNVERPI